MPKACAICAVGPREVAAQQAANPLIQASTARSGLIGGWARIVATRLRRSAQPMPPGRITQQRVRIDRQLKAQPAVVGRPG